MTTADSTPDFEYSTVSAKTTILQPNKRRKVAAGLRYDSPDELDAVGPEALSSLASVAVSAPPPNKLPQQQHVMSLSVRSSRPDCSPTRTPDSHRRRRSSYSASSSRSPSPQKSQASYRSRSPSRAHPSSKLPNRHGSSYKTRNPRSRSQSRDPLQSNTPSHSRSSSRSSPSPSPSTSRSRSRSRSQSSPRLDNGQLCESNLQTQNLDNSHNKPPPPIPPKFRPALILRGHTGPISQVRISPNGCWIASASADGTLKIWNATSGAHMDTLVGHMAGVSCLAWSPDGDTIASGSDDKAIRFWDRVTGRPKLSARNDTGAARKGGVSALRPMLPLLGHHNYIHCLAFSPKGNILASGSYDEAVFLWDVRAGRLMRSLPAHSDPVSGIDFSHDGTLVVSCSTDGLTRVWDASTGQCLRTLVHEDNPPVTNVCFSPNDRFVLASSLDDCLRLWDYVTGRVKKTYQGHTNKKCAIGTSFGHLPTGGAFIASASEDGRIVMWDVKNKQVIQTLKGHDGVCFWVDVQGNTMVSAGQDQTIRVYRNTVASLTRRHEQPDPTAPLGGAERLDPSVKQEEDVDMG